MTKVRVLNDDGIRKFLEYLAALHAEPDLEPPVGLLHDGLTSDPFEPAIELDDRPFGDAFELGRYMVEALSPCEGRTISRNHGLWSWLALHYFDRVCRADADGRRKPLEDAVYALEERFSFRRYYRHCVRTPWLAVSEHGELAKVLLLTSGRGTRTDIAEQLGAYQDLFANRSVIGAAYAMYFDRDLQKPKKGAGGKGAGSVRRLASVVRQLELTYDLKDCPLPLFLNLLPREFEGWVKEAGALS